MITLRRLDLVRQTNPATADELASLQTQLNALPLVGGAVMNVTPAAAPLSSLPDGFVEFEIRGKTYQLPLYLKA